MGRKIFAGTLIGLSSIFFVLSIVGIFMAWIYNEPLTRESTGRLKEIDSQLAQIQGDLQNAKLEVERALRIIDIRRKGAGVINPADHGCKTIIGEFK